MKTSQEPKYFYEHEAEQFQFFRFPKALITEPCFKDLSMDARVLYGLMLDRMSLSRKNQWIDEQARVFIIYTIDEVCDDLKCSRPTAIKILKELDAKDGIGLVERVRRGQGLPGVIYVMNFATFIEAATISTQSDDVVKEDETLTSRSKKPLPLEVKNFNFKKLKTLTSRSKKSLPLEVKNFNPNNTKNSHTERVVVVEPPPDKIIYQEKNDDDEKKSLRLGIIHPALVILCLCLMDRKGQRSSKGASKIV